MAGNVFINAVAVKLQCLVCSGDVELKEAKPGRRAAAVALLAINGLTASDCNRLGAAAQFC